MSLGISKNILLNLPMVYST